MRHRVWLVFVLTLLSGGLLSSSVKAQNSPPSGQLSLEFADDQAEPSCNLTADVVPATTGNAAVYFDYQSDQQTYRLWLESKAASLQVIREGKITTLNRAAVSWPARGQISVLRRPWMMQVLLDGKLLLRAWDATWTSGRLATWASGSWRWSPLRVQPVEPVYFTDDFTRLANQTGEWKANAGEWSISSSSENISQRNMDMSANPFAYTVKSPGKPAWAETGRWFWDNYLAEVAVKPSGNGAIGLACYVRDSSNYLALMWHAPGQGGERQLVQVQNGKSTVLARQDGGYLRRQWYQLAVRTSPGWVEAFIDHVLVFKVRQELWAQGGIALVAQSMAEVQWDDVKVESYEYYRQEFSGSLSGAWTPLQGKWFSAGGALQSRPSAPTAGGSRFLLAGRHDWQDYEFIASARPSAGAGCGLVVGFVNDANYAVFRWADPTSKLPYKGRQQFLRYTAGKARVVSDEPLRFAVAPGQWVRLRVALSGGVATVYQGDEVVAQMADETLTRGRLAFYAQSVQPVQFRDAVLYFPAEPAPPKVPPRMADDALMVGWASPNGEWPVTPSGDSPQYWNTGEFFGDCTLEYAWNAALTNPGTRLEMALRARPKEFTSGLMVRLEALPANQLKLSVLQNEAVLREVETAWPEISQGSSPSGIKVETRGKALLVRVNETPLLSLVATQPLPEGTSVAMRARGISARPREMRAFSALRDDYTFTQAPVEWLAPSGAWSVFSRWPCYSDWSFFGGRGVNPALWSKRSYGGKVVVEMYAHNQMDLPKEIGYGHPGDLNITIGGDGQNPSSGYSFIVAGWNNSHSGVMRGSKVLEESWAEGSRFPKPINHNYTFHKRWFYVRASMEPVQREGKNGVQLELAVDDVPLVKAFDPDPLPGAQGGQVAFWTVNGTLMIARAKVESSHPGGWRLTQGPDPWTQSSGENPREAAPRPVVEDDIPMASVSNDGGGWKVINPSAGGLFAVDLQPLLPEEGGGVLEWEMQGRELYLDLLWFTSQAGFRTPLPGQKGVVNSRFSDLPAASSEPMDDGWVRYRARIPTNTNLKQIKQVVLGTYPSEEYALAGFHSNPAGASYRLRRVRFAPDHS